MNPLPPIGSLVRITRFYKGFKMDDGPITGLLLSCREQEPFNPALGKSFTVKLLETNGNYFHFFLYPEDHLEVLIET